MKSDFVTNSSSTAFILIGRSQLTLKGIQKLVGIPKGSALEPIAQSLFELLERSGRRIDDVNDPFVGGHELATAVVERMRAAMAEGREVRVGTFRSDGDEMESFLCSDSFEAEDDEFYLNALRCSW